MSIGIRKIFSVIAAITLLSGVAFATEEEHRHKEPTASNPSGDTGKHEPGMHMHKSDITHMKDSEVATQFKGEAAQLREQAESHRKLAKLYQSRLSGGKTTSVNYASVAKHCEQLAKAYDDAATAAEAAAMDLAK